MALTKAREIALFMILEVPYTTTSYTLYGDGGKVAQTSDVTGSARAAKTLILNHLTNEIYPDAAVTTVLENLLDLWIDLGTDITTIDAGSIGNVQGINNSVKDERTEIQRQVLILVPFWRVQDQILRSSGNGAFIPVCR